MTRDRSTDTRGVLTREIEIPDSAIDVNGHANNLEYLRWMQDIATLHSAAQGWPLERYLATRTSWVIRSHFIEYLRPAFAGETLAIATWIAGFGEQASPRRYLFWRPDDRRMVARAETVWVYVNAATGRPARIPDEFRAAFEVLPDEREVTRGIGIDTAVADAAQ